MAYKSKEDRNEYQRKRYAENESVRLAQREATKRWQENNPQSYTPDSRRQWTMTYRYGMTIEEYEKKLAGQGGHCALCPATQESYARRMSVDHNHACCPGQKSCGKCVRGILCANCNRKVGFLEEIMSDGIVMPGAGSWTQKSLDYLSCYSVQSPAESQNA